MFDEFSIDFSIAFSSTVLKLECENGTDSVMLEILPTTEIIHVHLGGNSWSCSIFKNLNNNLDEVAPNLKELYLFSFADYNIGRLPKTLEKLTLSYPKDNSYPKISEILEDCPNLIDLNLIDYHVGQDTHEIADKLKNKTRLSYLNLQSNRINSEGATVIAEALEINNTLTHLHLARNNIGNKGAEALLRTLEKNYSLTYLNLENQNEKIDSDILKQIDQFLQRNKYISEELAKEPDPKNPQKRANVFRRLFGNIQPIPALFGITVFYIASDPGRKTQALNISLPEELHNKIKDYIL